MQVSANISVIYGNFHTYSMHGIWCLGKMTLQLL